MYSSDYQVINMADRQGMVGQGMVGRGMVGRGSGGSVQNFVNFFQLKLEENECMATLVDPKYPRTLDPKKFEEVLRKFEQLYDYNTYTGHRLNRFDDELSVLLRCLTKLKIPEYYVGRYNILLEFLVQDRGRCEDVEECHGICVAARYVDELEYFLEKADDEMRAENMAAVGWVAMIITLMIVSNSM